MLPLCCAAPITYVRTGLIKQRNNSDRGSAHNDEKNLRLIDPKPIARRTPTKPNVFQRSNFEPDEGEESDASQEDPDVEGEGGAPGPMADLAEDADPEQPGKEVLDAVA